MAGGKRWMWIDWLIFSLRCGWYATGLTYYYVYGERLGHLSYGEFAAFVSLGFIVPLIFWRPGYSHPTLYALSELVLSGGFSIYINIFLGINLSTSIILMPILMIGYLMTQRTAPWTIPLFVILLPANRYWTIDNLFSFYLQYIDVLLFFGIGLGFNIITNSQKRYKHLLAENIKQVELIEEQNKALEQYAAEVEKLALLEERNRMARDLHDSIGHHFTSVTVGLDAISYMMESHPKLAAEKLTRLAEVAREGLSEVRRTIHQMAPTEGHLPLTTQLKKLTEDFEAHTNTKVSLEILGTEPAVSPRTKLTFVRCLQECMTNAKRHGEASSISAALHFTDVLISLKVSNDGKRVESAAFGFGLTAMKNRLEEHGGTLVIDNKEGEGVVVMASLPLRR